MKLVEKQKYWKAEAFDFACKLTDDDMSMTVILALTNPKGAHCITAAFKAYYNAEDEVQDEARAKFLAICESLNSN